MSIALLIASGERIAEKELAKDKKRAPFPIRKKTLVRDHSKKNLKIAAASYSQAGSIAELEKQIAAKSALAKTARESLVETEHQLKDFGQ